MSTMSLSHENDVQPISPAYSETLSITEKVSGKKRIYTIEIDSSGRILKTTYGIVGNKLTEKVKEYAELRDSLKEAHAIAKRCIGKGYVYSTHDITITPAKVKVKEEEDDADVNKDTVVPKTKTAKTPEKRSRVFWPVLTVNDANSYANWQEKREWARASHIYVGDVLVHVSQRKLTDKAIFTNCDFSITQYDIDENKDGDEYENDESSNCDPDLDSDPPMRYTRGGIERAWENISPWVSEAIFQVHANVSGNRSKVVNIIDVVPRSSLSPSSSLKGDVELNKKRATYYEDDDVVINVCIQNIILPQNVTWTLSKRMNMDEIKDYHDDFCNNYREKPSTYIVGMFPYGLLVTPQCMRDDGDGDGDDDDDAFKMASKWNSSVILSCLTYEPCSINLIGYSASEDTSAIVFCETSNGEKTHAYLLGNANANHRKGARGILTCLKITDDSIVPMYARVL